MEKFEMYQAIIKRAEELGIDVDNKLSVTMDIESADKVFHLQLEDWLNADDLNFMSDFSGIVSYIDRSSFPATNFNGFVPRFAGQE